jgi:hypothetical protein
MTETSRDSRRLFRLWKPEPNRPTPHHLTPKLHRDAFKAPHSIYTSVQVQRNLFGERDPFPGRPKPRTARRGARLVAPEASLPGSVR